jgi:hypothetical protein|tara:strand:- start:1481 stop:1795 length:315 start_codon:yes stop_codon:yes gene_type:complete
MSKLTLEDFEEMGFDFFLDWTMDAPITSERVQTPSGRKMDVREIRKELEELGSKDQNYIEYLQALEFYKLVSNLDVNERCMRYSTSFIDDNDIEQCRIKYPQIN